MPATVDKPIALQKQQRRAKAAAPSAAAKTLVARVSPGSAITHKGDKPAKPTLERSRVKAVPRRSRNGPLILRHTKRATRGKAAVGAPGSLHARLMADVDDYVRRVGEATPMQIVELERSGVIGSFIKNLSKRMELPASRMFTIIRVPKATAEKKAAAGQMVAGSAGQATIGLVRLLAIAEKVVANSTAKEAKGFDTAKWLGRWIERPQPSLGGHKPADMLDTPTGVEIVARLLRSIESGAYQ